MDRQVLEMLRKARQSYWEAGKNCNAWDEEKKRKPQPNAKPKTKWVGGCLLRGFLFFGVLPLVLTIAQGVICAAIGIDMSEKNNIQIIFSIMFWILTIVWIISLVKWFKRIAKKNTSSYNAYLNGVFAQQVRQWQECVDMKHEIAMRSMRQHRDNLEACADILPRKYLEAEKYYGKHPLLAITQYIEDMRADTIKEAINLYEEDEREARRDQEDAAHKRQVEGYAAQQAYAAQRMADASEREARAQEDANKIAKRRASAAEDAAANSKKSAEELETIRRIHTGERGV